MDIKKYITEYRDFIIEFENSIKEKYQIKDSIYNYIDILFKKNDLLGKYEYFFHGSGCKVIRENVICEYDFLDYDENFKYQFSIWKLKIFIESAYKISVDQIELKNLLEELVLQNKLEKLILGGRIFDIYLI